MTQTQLLAQDKDVVVPGQAIAHGMEFLPGNGTYRHEETILVSQIGILHVEGKVLKVTPLAGRYLPNTGDMIIGKVIDILMSGWRVEINSPYQAVLPLQEASFDFIRKGADLTEYFDLGDFIVCKITQVTSQNLIDVTMKEQGLRKLKGGHFVSVNPAKVPRLIGRRGSMVGMLKHATGCEVIVGQNGVVWINGETEKEVIAVRAIQIIDENAHVSGLTERIRLFLEEATGTQIDLEAITAEAERQFEQRAQQPQRRFDGPRRDDRGGGDRRGPPRRDDRGGGDRRGPPRQDRGGRGNFGGERRPPREESFQE